MARSTLQPPTDFTAQPAKDLTTQQSNLSDTTPTTSQTSTATQVNSLLASDPKPEKYLDQVAKTNLK